MAIRRHRFGGTISPVWSMRCSVALLTNRLKSVIAVPEPAALLSHHERDAAADSSDDGKYCLLLDHIPVSLPDTCVNDIMRAFAPSNRGACAQESTCLRSPSSVRR